MVAAHLLVEYNKFSDIENELTQKDPLVSNSVKHLVRFDSSERCFHASQRATPILPYKSKGLIKEENSESQSRKENSISFVYNNKTDTDDG